MFEISKAIECPENIIVRSLYEFDPLNIREKINFL